MTRELTEEELFPIAVTLEHRRRQIERGMINLLRPLPPCPTCSNMPEEIIDWAPQRAAPGCRKTTFQPCGHGFTYSNAPACAAVNRARLLATEQENAPLGGAPHKSATGVPLVEAPTVAVPLAALRRLVEVAVHVSRGRSAADIGRYPDATARRALGELHDAGLLAQVTEPPAEPEPQPRTTVPCSWTVLSVPHQAHRWEPQPGIEPAWCTGTPIQEYIYQADDPQARALDSHPIRPGSTT